MPITQKEADHLLRLEKLFVARETVGFESSRGFKQMHELHSRDNREAFLLDVERSERIRARLKFQTRARRSIVLARIDIAGKAHRNLDHYPHRPGERFTGVHIHLYHEGFEDRVAYLPEDLPDFPALTNPHDLEWLFAFFRFCHIIDAPPIQSVI